MKNSLLVSLILVCSTVFATTSYEERMVHLWEGIVVKCEAKNRGGFLPEDMQFFLETTAEELQPGDTILVSFYPNRSGFDQIVEDPSAFLKLKDFFTLVEEAGFQVESCQPQRHFAFFETLEQMQEFVWKRFGTVLKGEDIPLKIPTKIVLAKLVFGEERV